MEGGGHLLSELRHSFLLIPLGSALLVLGFWTHIVKSVLQFSGGYGF